MIPAALRWSGDAAGHLEILDQTLLPARLEWIACADVGTVVEAIRSLRVRGAPAIGIAGGYGLAVAAGEAVRAKLSSAAARAHILARGAELATARPTAVNLRWAVDRCLGAIAPLPGDADATTLGTALLAEARAIHDEDRQLCAAIGRHGAPLLPDGGVLTHCNTGALATGGDGTALGVITAAWDQGRKLEVFADETRPLFQGARLTAWELGQRGIPVTVLADAAAGHLLRTGRIRACIVGADRITARGDTANKIGTYALAVLAHAHDVPFYVAAPSSTFDLTLDDGADIPIEERGADEVLRPLGVQAAPAGARAYNPAFDVTPARLIRGIVTERGVITPVTRENVLAMLRQEAR
ncbi:MAG: S-methyl-5-thioribose-1-phosphate isomerase [Planctomycetaceae bacterium]|nr:S-methyl-5-thioribose-1-phosphate isomerase [Planctomycetaceae bacterium]